MSTVATDDSHAIAMLCAPIALGDAKPLTTSEWAKLAERIHASEIGRPSVLASLSPEQIVEALSVEGALAERVSHLFQRGGTLAFELERLEGRGIWMITRADDSYPERLRARLRLKSPPILFGVGSRDAVNFGGVAIVGSRDASPSSLEFTDALGAKLGRERTTVVSGAARGVDRAAMTSALHTGGVAIGVVADNLLRLTQQVETRRLLEDERLTLLTPYAPTTRFTAGNAMGRNKLIYCLADAAVVASASAETGGTWAGAIENLRHRWVPTWSWADRDAPPGNRALIEAGARPLRADELPDAHVAEWLASRGAVESSADGSQAGGDLFEVVWPALADFLIEPRSERDVAEQFSLELSQVRAWLRRAVEEGLGDRRARPVRYVASTRPQADAQPRLFEAIDAKD